MVKEIVTKKELQLIDTLSTTAEKALKIKTDKDVEKAADIMLTLKGEYDELEEKRKSYVKPAQTTVSLLNTDFKKLTEPRERYLTLLRQKVVEYVSIRKKEIKSKEQEVQKDMKDRSLVLDNGMDRIYCDNGELRFKKGYTIKITNKKLIPEKYHFIDEKAILKDVTATKGGVNIPGVKIAIDPIHSVAIYKNK